VFPVELTFRGDLPWFLPPAFRGVTPVQRVLKEKTAVKDVIEACGVPHPEVDLILVRDASGERHSVDFACVVQEPLHIEIYPVPAPAVLTPDAPRLQMRSWDRFVVDGHLGKLARNLRLLGFDTAYDRDADDRQLLEIMIAEDRALLTRDRRLLMHSIVRHGYSPRSQEGEEQTREVLRRFGLCGDAERFASYRRCLRCNGLLERVSKADVLEALADEPLTLRYYDEFHRCTGCGRIYWPGTHFEKLAARVRNITTSRSVLG
jgi:uncharacterized protein with PIN domain